MLKLAFFTGSTIFITSCQQADSNTPRAGEPTHVASNSLLSTDTTKPIKPKQLNNYYPFELQEFDGRYQVVAHIEGKDLYPKYYDFFQKHGYEGNGYCWEGHITQILEKLDKSLLSHIDFDPEAGSFYAQADSKESQLKFVELLSPIFSDISKLEEWVKKADRERIDD